MALSQSSACRYRLAGQVAASAVLLAFFFAPRFAPAQITVENLIGKVVDNIGPQHKDVESAISSFSKGDFVEARRLLESAKTSNPDLPPPGVMLAQLLYAASQPELARGELEKVVRDEPSDPEPYLLFAEIAYQQRRFTDSELGFAKALEYATRFDSNPKRKQNMLTRAYSGLAAIAEAREDWKTAQKFLQPMIDADPENSSAATRMAQAVFQQGDEQAAYKILQALWTRDNSITRPEITMGLLYEKAGKRPNAEKLMSLASDRDQDRIESQLRVAQWAMEAGQLELAKKCATRAIKIDPASIEAKLVMGLVARHAKDLPTARKAFEAAHLQSPANLAAMLQLAVVLLDQGGERTAAEYAQISTRLYSDLSQPTGREAAVTFAWVLFRLGKTTEAQQALQKALAGGSLTAESSYYAARIAHQQGNSELAKKLLESALNADRAFPTRPDAEELLKQLGG